MHKLEQRLRRLEPPPVGHRLHVIETRDGDEEGADAILASIGEQPGDLTVWLQRFADDPLPPRHLYSVALAGPNKGARVQPGVAGDAYL